MMISLVTTISHETQWERLVDLIFSRVSSSSVSKSWNNRERVKKAYLCRFLIIFTLVSMLSIYMNPQYGMFHAFDGNLKIHIMHFEVILSRVGYLHSIDLIRVEIYFIDRQTDGPTCPTNQSLRIENKCIWKVVCKVRFPKCILFTHNIMDTHIIVLCIWSLFAKFNKPC